MEFSVEFLGEIDLVAIYAAILSTAIFIWELIKWLNRGPKLEGRAISNMVIVGGSYLDKKHYIRCNIYNRGNETTTINNIGLLGFKTKRDIKKNKPEFSAIIPQDNFRLPCKLEVGGEFSAMCIQDNEVVKKTNEMELYFAIYHSFSDHATLFRIYPIEKKP